VEQALTLAQMKCSFQAESCARKPLQYAKHQMDISRPVFFPYFYLLLLITEISCGDLPIVQNTNSSATASTGRRYEDTVTYTCVTGYEITRGSGTITCQSNRSWSTPPTCESKF